MSDPVVYRPEAFPFGVRVVHLDTIPGRDRRIGTAAVQFKLGGHDVQINGIALRRAKGRNAGVTVSLPKIEGADTTAIFMPPEIWTTVVAAVRERLWEDAHDTGRRW